MSKLRLKIFFILVALIAISAFAAPVALADHCVDGPGPNFSHPTPDSDYPCYKTAAKTGFDFTLQLTNIGFVIAIIAIGFATILKRKNYAMDQALPRLIIIAILINFSWFFATGLIYISNTIGNAFLHVFMPGGLNSLSSFGAFSYANTTPLIGTLIAVFANFLFGMIVVFTMLATAIMMLIRYLALTVLLILMPLAILANIFPNLEFTGGLYKKWQSNFVKWILFFPATMFFVAIAFKMASESGSIGGDIINQLVYSLITLGILISGLLVSNSLGLAGAGYAQGVAGFAMRRGVGYAAGYINSVRGRTGRPSPSGATVSGGPPGGGGPRSDEGGPLRLDLHPPVKTPPEITPTEPTPPPTPRGLGLPPEDEELARGAQYQPLEETARPPEPQTPPPESDRIEHGMEREPEEATTGERPKKGYLGVVREDIGSVTRKITGVATGTGKGIVGAMDRPGEAVTGLTKGALKGAKDAAGWGLDRLGTWGMGGPGAKEVLLDSGLKELKKAFGGGEDPFKTLFDKGDVEKLENESRKTLKAREKARARRAELKAKPNRTEDEDRTLKRLESSLEKDGEGKDAYERRNDKIIEEIDVRKFLRKSGLEDLDPSLFKKTDMDKLGKAIEAVGKEIKSLTKEINDLELKPEPDRTTEEKSTIKAKKRELNIYQEYVDDALKVQVRRKKGLPDISSFSSFKKEDAERTKETGGGGGGETKK